MQLFCVKPKVHSFDRVEEFAAAFAPGPDDLLLIERFMYERFFKPLGLSCAVICKDDYEKGEPSEDAVDRILLDIAGRPLRRIIAVGGGSVIDIAKLMTVRDAYPIGRVIRGEIPPETDKTLIVLPTTCGTGSEVTNGGIVAMKDTGYKTGILDERLTAAHAVLIPELIAGLPYGIFTACSIDALGHSMEAYISKRSNEFVRAVGARSIRLILAGYADIVNRGPESRLEHLQAFLSASCLGGMAVNNSSAGPAHALAYPLGEKYKVPHGETIRQFLSPVLVGYQAEAPGGLLDELADLLLPALDAAGYCARREDAFAALDRLLDAVSPRRPLREYGMQQSEIQSFTESVFATKQRLLSTSCVPFTRARASAIYAERY